MELQKLLFLTHQIHCHSLKKFQYFFPLLFRPKFKTPAIAAPHSYFTFVHHMNHCTLVCSNHFFGIGTAFMLLDEIAVEVISIDRLSLPCYHVAVVQVILIGTPFKILGSVVGLDFIYMIDNQSFLVTRNKVQGYKPVYLIVLVISSPVAK